MFSIVYTPTEGDAIQNYSRLFRKPAGLFLNIHDIDRVPKDMARWAGPEDIDYIVVTGKLPEGYGISHIQGRDTETLQMARKSSASGTRGAAASRSPSPSSFSPPSALGYTRTESSPSFWIAAPTTRPS